MIKLIFICICLVIAAACESKVYDPDIPEVVSLDKDLQPIFNRSCVSCHERQDQPPPTLTPDVAYQEIMSGGYVIPGDAENSLFYIRLIGDPDIRGGRTMPPAEPLPSHEIQLIKEWINQGAQNN